MALVEGIAVTKVTPPKQATVPLPIVTPPPLLPQVTLSQRSDAVVAQVVSGGNSPLPVVPLTAITSPDAEDDPPDELGDTARSMLGLFAASEGRSLQVVDRPGPSPLRGPSPPIEVIDYIRRAIDTAAWPANVILGVRAAMLIVRKGVPYVWGGTNPNKGLDCSGFAQYVLRVAGDNTLHRTTYEQATQGREVKAGDRQPLDLCFFERTESGPGHVAIYLAQGWAVHEPHTGLDAQWLNLASWTPLFTRRYLKTMSAQETPGVPAPTSVPLLSGDVYDRWKPLVRRFTKDIPKHHSTVKGNYADLWKVFT